jgi:hypothetical protein
MDSVYVDNFQDAEIFCLSPILSGIGYTCILAVVLSSEEAGTAAAVAVAAAVAAAVPAVVAEKE